jgi:L-ribulose-5-phosphate 3-epimerase
MTYLGRRDLLKSGVFAALAGLSVGRQGWATARPLFRISLAQWSLHRTFFGDLPEGVSRGELLRTDPDSALRGTEHPLDFPTIARRDYGLAAVEYVNTFMYGHADDESYLDDLNRRAADAGVANLLIMCDSEGALGDPDSTARSVAVENHVKWLRAAAHLGCHSIRVNAQSSGAEDEQQHLAADGLHRLAERAEEFRLNVIVENHGGLSSRGSWLVNTLRLADHTLLGTLPDFGNFNVSGTEQYDKYLGVAEMMPMARAVSAKSHDFDDEGNEVGIDYRRMMKIVLDAGYGGWVGVEYEGGRLSEKEGIKATVSLLETVRKELEN